MIEKEKQERFLVLGPIFAVIVFFMSIYVAGKCIEEQKQEEIDLKLNREVLSAEIQSIVPSEIALDKFLLSTYLTDFKKCGACEKTSEISLQEIVCIMKFLKDPFPAWYTNKLIIGNGREIHYFKFKNIFYTRLYFSDIFDDSGKISFWEGFRVFYPKLYCSECFYKKRKEWENERD